MIAERILEQKNTPYISLDWLVMGFTNGMPECGIHDLLFPDDIAQRLWGFLRAMCESILWQETDCVIEGEAILPELVSELLNKYPDKIKISEVGEVAKKVTVFKFHIITTVFLFRIFNPLCRTVKPDRLATRLCRLGECRCCNAGAASDIENPHAGL